MERNIQDFEITANEAGFDTEIKIDGKMPPGIYAYELHSSVNEVTQLDLHFHAIPIKVKGKAEINYKFDLPDDEEVQKELYEQLKEKFEEES